MEFTILFDYIIDKWGYFGAVGCLLFLVVFKEHRLGLYHRVKEFLTGHGKTPDKRTALQASSVKKELIELCTRTSSDRSFIMRFHNGTSFVLSDPQWKVTCSQEVVRNEGISYVADNMNNMLVTKIMELINPIITGTESSGITNYKCKKCKFKPVCDKKRFNIVYQIDELEGSFTKTALERDNVKTLVLAGIMHGNGIIGMIGISYCDKKMDDEKQLAEMVPEVCRSADNIQYILQK